MIDWAPWQQKFAGLRVALVHDWLNGMRGGEKVLETIGRIFPRAPIYTLLAVPAALSDELRSHPIVPSFLQGYPFFQKHYRHFLPFFPAAIEDFDLAGFDLVISTSHCVAKGAIPGPNALHFCYCHSPMRYAWDQEHAYFPNRRGPVARLRGMLLSRLRQWDVASCPRVDHFWANSRFVAQRLRRFYGRDAEVLPPPIDTDAFCASMLEKQEGGGHNPASTPAPENPVQSPRPSVRIQSSVKTQPAEGPPFCLAVSALVPYKRLELAILACEQLGFPLRIVGSGPEEARLARLCGRNARLLGRVSDEELRRLYREAAFFLQPGVEDFGMAAVEALASGTPVVAVGEGGVLDIVTDGEHGVLYSGFGVDDLVRAIDKAGQIRFNILKLIQRAEFFSVDSFVTRLASSLDRRLSSGAPC
jgi:glycosyltransferase involved in cell wall biosynthesis